MGNQKETQKNPQYKYASTREKLCFGIGAIGKDAICNLVGAFLMLWSSDCRIQRKSGNAERSNRNGYSRVNDCNSNYSCICQLWYLQKILHFKR